MARDRASRPEARPLRLFVAVEVPEPIREVVRAAVGPLRERFPKARWVPLPNQHVTVKFLGATWPRLVDWVTEAVGAVAGRHEPFRTHVGALGAFPTERRARVLWASLEDPWRFEPIVASLEDALAREFAREKRAFTAHLTVARFAPPVDLSGTLGDADVRSDPFVVDRLVLYRSHLRRPAPVYEALGTFPLGTPPGR